MTVSKWGAGSRHAWSADHEPALRHRGRRDRRSAPGNTTTTTTARTPASGTSRRSSSWRRRGWNCVRR